MTKIVDKTNLPFAIRSLRHIGILMILGGCYSTTNLYNQKPNYTPDEQTLSRGQGLYVEYCQSCHGSDLPGNGPKAASLPTRPANLREKSLHITQTNIKSVIDYPHYSKETIQDKIKYGNKAMPPLKDVLSGQQINDLKDYIGFAIR